MEEYLYLSNESIQARSLRPSKLNVGEDHEKVRRDLVEKRIAASQRALQFGGDAIREKNARMYNCTVSFADRPAFFAEAFYLLLCGCGVGFSVQRHHVASLIFNQGEGEYEHLVSDSVEGWADAVRALANHYFNQSPRPLFNFELIRGKSAPLRHGGLAPGDAGDRGRIGSSDPDPDHMLAIEPQRPGIAVAIGGARLEGDLVRRR